MPLFGAPNIEKRPSRSKSILNRLAKRPDPEAGPPPLTRLYELALACELEDPRAGIAAYEQCERSNRDVIRRILVVAALAFPLAYVVAYYVTAWIGKFEGVVAAVIIGVLGAGPMYALFFQQCKRRGLVVFPDLRLRGRSEDYFLSAYGMVILLGMTLFGSLLQLAVILVLTAILFALAFALPYGLVNYFLAGGPVLDVDAIPFVPGLVAFYTIFAGVLIVFAADVRTTPLELPRIVRQLPWGLKANAGRTVSWVGDVTFGVLLGYMVASNGLVYRDLRVGIPAYLVVGAFMGEAFQRTEKDPMLGVLIEVGKARCRLQTGEWLRADYELWAKMEGFRSMIPATYALMADALLRLLNDLAPGREERLLEALSDARSSLRSDDPHFELCLKNIERIQCLALASR